MHLADVAVRVEQLHGRDSDEAVAARARLTVELTAVTFDGPFDQDDGAAAVVVNVSAADAADAMSWSASLMTDARHRLHEWIP